MIKTVAISEDVFDRLNRLSVTNDVSIAKLVDLGLDYLETKYIGYVGTWDEFLEYTSPLLQFFLHDAIWHSDEGDFFIAVNNKYAYQQLKIHKHHLEESLKSFYRKDYSVSISMVNDD